ncbi:sensor histidine kinase [Paenibacillus azoreducens]|uniref:histidine kinase n=1 Tax=Paenibacillus azoreducens TaxID=116718 RepID=A0A919YIH5_9BACL|nr:sensor histidine kinase [Paenibacillus azoreducens]GIO49968.1 sensor protein BceS [Paenibacillus azoreducens]
MFIRYLIDMKSWILFFLASLGLTDLLIWIDKGVAMQLRSIIYLNVLLLLGFILFLAWRWKMETKYLRGLVRCTETLEGDWAETLPEAVFARDEITDEALRAVDRFYRSKLSDYRKDWLAESEYMASWVHEVKAPLTAMKLAIDSRRSDPDMRRIEAEWLRVHLLLDRQLYMTRLPSLASDYVLKEENVQQLAAQEVRELASWCMEKNIAVEIEGEARQAMTDSKWCRFIIRQILTNAVKYSPAGGTIMISTGLSANGNVVLTIRDEGPGIPAQDLPRIFDKGFTGETGRIQHAATGLGLYLAQAAAEGIGITLAAESAKGSGTAVSLAFASRNDFDSVRT